MDLRNDQSNFVFLACSERSGSNFITKLMNNHSKICGPSTKHIINPLARNYFRYQPLDKKEHWDELLKDVLNLFNVSFSVWKAEFTLDELRSEVETGDLKGLIRYFFDKEAVVNGKKHLFIKEIKLYEFYPFLKTFFPESKYIYQVRDPRDMALSWKKNKTHKGGVVAAARQWKNDQQQYLKIKALEETSNNIALVRYEDLVSQTPDQLKMILDVCGLDFELEMTEMGKDDLTNKNAQQQKAWENLSKPIMQDNFNKFKKELSEDEIKYIEAICFFEMEQFGYLPENKWEALELVTNKELDKHHQRELEMLEYSPASGVQANMEAKKVFYQKIIQSINVS
ncbi:MAG TPA: sulfotransferase [Salinimicrobium sp.]|nr:sulfotransferase [Salinimicrobium sp.]